MKGAMSDCPVQEECLEWAYTYLKDCVCSFRDEISLSLGLISVFSWGVAEVPQIITNFREKSTEGVSLAFLMTWVVGDAFNLAGCYLEPATLPTQFYMALMYTVTTVILVGQTIYYDYIYKWRNLKAGYEAIDAPSEKQTKLDVEALKPEQPSYKSAVIDSQTAGTSPPTSVINVPSSLRNSSKQDLYYTSARSLASSHNPGMGSYLAGSREHSGSAGTQSFLRSSPSVPRTDLARSGSSLRTAAASILLVGSVGLTSNMVSFHNVIGRSGFQGGQLFITGRRLLQISHSRSGHVVPIPRRGFFGEVQAEGPWGEIFGWCMAAIYMGGRLPQILLNIRRGTVEGLNPLMFLFALTGNATYVGSILVRSMRWVSIKPNMPWLVDAAVCVVLDLFILCQFLYYRMKKVEEDSDSDFSDSKEQKKVVN